jgi:transcription initiation factor IIE alpha subunit
MEEETILALLKGVHPHELTTRQLSDFTGLGLGIVRRLVYQLAEKGEVAFRREADEVYCRYLQVD